MSTRISYGYGFSSSILSENEFKQLQKSIEIQKYDDDYIKIVPFGDSKISHNWSTIILEKVYSSEHGQMLTISEIKNIENEYYRNFSTKIDEFVTKLTSFKLEKFINHVELLFFIEHE